VQQRTQWWVFGSGVLMLVGAFGPWVTVLGVELSGTDSTNDGWLVVAAAAIGSGVSYAMRRRRDAGVWALLGGLAGLAVTAYDRQDLQRAINEGGAFVRALAQVGWGLNLALIASISMAVAGAFALVQARRSAPAATPLEPVSAPNAPPPVRPPPEQAAAPVDQPAPDAGEPASEPPAPGWARTPPAEPTRQPEPGAGPPEGPEAGA
jgi:hypothetical protein